jgi:hypothetical protein
LELGFEPLEDAFVVVFPELLAGVFACYAREDLLAAWTEMVLLALARKDGTRGKGGKTGIPGCSSWNCVKS